MSNNDKMSDSDYRWSDDSEQYQTLQTKIQTSRDLDMREQSLADQNINNKTDDNGQKLKLEDQNIDSETNNNIQKSEKEKSEKEKSEKEKSENEKSENEKSKKLEKPKKLELEEQAITKSDIKSVIRLLQQIASGVIELQGIKPYEYNEKGRETTRRGRVHIFKYTNYYDVTNTIKRVGSEDPQDFDSPVYNREKIFEVLERYSDLVHVINGGTNPLFIIVSHEGLSNFSRESIIFPGEVKDFYNVYELRLRSPEVGLQYRVTEYEIMSVSQTSLIPIELATLQDVDLPEKDTNWLEKDITPLVTPTTVRVEVAVSIPGIFSAVITREGNTQIIDFNVTSGPDLIADGLYTFEIMVHKGDNINFRYSTDDGKIKILRVDEIDAATS